MVKFMNKTIHEKLYDTDCKQQQTELQAHELGQAYAE